MCWIVRNLLRLRVFTGNPSEQSDDLVFDRWGIDITSVKVASGKQAWEQTVSKVWPHRNDYVHRGDDATASDAALAIDCLKTLLSDAVDPPWIEARLHSAPDWLLSKITAKVGHT
jgi:hypothetical protein